MMHQRPMMRPTRKEFLRREMLACARVCRGELKYGGDVVEAQKWADLAAKRLFQLGGMLAKW
jgi:hypothetical protein